MRKLAIVTAAAAVVAAMFTLPAATASADPNTEAAILKCAEQDIVGEENDQLDVFAGTFPPIVVQVQTSEGLPPGQSLIGTPCADAIAIAHSDFSCQLAGPPVVVANKLDGPAPNGLFGPQTPPGPRNGLRAISVEKYVFICGPGRGK